MTVRRRRRTPVKECSLALIVALGSLTGCSLVPGSSSEGVSSREADVLEDRIQEFQYRYVKKLGQAMVQIEESSDESRVKSYANYFRLLSSPYARDAVYRSDPLTGLLDLWALCVQTRDFFLMGEQDARLGSDSRAALAAGEALVREIEQIAAETLEGEILENARITVYAFCEKYPAKAPFSRETIRTYFQEEGESIGVGWLYDQALTPFRAIGGLDETAIAIHEIAHAAEEMTAVVSDLPDRIRLQSKVFLYDATGNAEVSGVFGSLDRISKTAERLTLTANELPTRIREEVGTLIEDASEQGPELQTALTELRSTLETLESTLDAATRTTEGLDRAGGSLQGTLSEFRSMMREMGVDGEDPAPPETDEPPAKPFDITEYTETALAISEAADSLVAVLQQADPLVVAEESAFDVAADRVEELSWTITVCGLVFVLGTSVVIMGHRRVSRRLAARDAPPVEPS